MKVVMIELEVRLVLLVLGGGVEVDVSSSGRMVEVVKVVSMMTVSNHSKFISTSKTSSKKSGKKKAERTSINRRRQHLR